MALFYLPLLAGEQLYRRDTWLLFLGCRRYLGERLAAGEFPVWFPYDGLGVPFHAQAMCGALHPLSLLAAVVRPELVLSLQTLAAVGLGAWSVWVLARALGASPVGCAVGAIGYALSGYVTSVTANIAYVWGAGAFAAQLAAFGTSALGGWRPARVAAAALATTSTVLIGDLQGAYFFTLAAGAFGLALAPPRARLRYVAGSVGVGALIAGLSAPQLLPSWYMLQETARSSGMDWETVSYWSLHPLRLPELFLAGFSPLGHAGRARELFGWQPGYLLWAEALGGSAALSALAVAALGSSRIARRTRLALGGLCLVGLLLALGRFGGLYRLLYGVLPLMQSFRWPEKLVPLFLCGWAVLAALGWSALSRSWARGLAAGAGGLALLAAALWLWPVEQPVAADYVQDLALSCLAGAVAVAGLALLVRQPARTAELALLALVAGEVAWSAGGAYDTLPLEHSAQEPTTVAVLRELGVGLGRARVINAGMAYSPLDEEGYLTEAERELASVDRAALLGAMGSEYHVEVAQSYLQGYPAELRLVMRPFPNWVRAIAPRLNVAALLTPAGGAQAWASAGPRPVASTPEGVDVLRLPEPWPRAYLAGAVPALPGEAVREQLTALPPGQVLIPGWPQPEPSASGEVEVREYAAERVVLRVRAPREAFLVLNDTYMSGWSVSVDGQPATAVRANVVVRAVRVPTGEHEVVWSYEAPGLRSGLGLMVGALAVAMALWALSAIAARRTGTPSAPQA